MKKIVYVLAFYASWSVFASNSASVQDKIVVCNACHGPQGVSVNPLWPSLAGQHAPYLLKQMMDFKQNRGRSSPLMATALADLTEQDMNEIAAFYAQLPTPDALIPKKDFNRGQQLYRGGDFSKHITACIACHGPKGTGNTEANFPALSGQQAPYLTLQLQAFKNHQRQNDLNSIMRDIAKRMSLEDMQAVSNYAAGLH